MIGIKIKERILLLDYATDYDIKDPECHTS